MEIDSYEYWKGTSSVLRERHGEDDFPFLHEDLRLQNDAPFGLVFKGDVDMPYRPGDEARLHEVLEEAFHRHNKRDRPLGCLLPSMVTGDVVILNLRAGNEWNGTYKKVAYVVKSIGFEEIDAEPFREGSKYLAGPTKLGGGRHLIEYQKELEDRA